MTDNDEFPVHDSLVVLDGNTIYRTDNWFKAAVLYRYDGNEYDSTELAIYLWHRKGQEWKRKQKYVVKTIEGWEADKASLERFLPALNGDPVPEEIEKPDEVLPVSDYYNVDAGATVFETDEWWKATVVIDAKGDYETTEVILYVWQRTDDDWKCRQKYPIKRYSDWEADLAAIEEFIGELDSAPGSEGENDGTVSSRVDDCTAQDNREMLQKALEARHLSRELTGDREEATH